MVVLYDSLQLAHKCILNSFYGYVMRKGYNLPKNLSMTKVFFVYNYLLLIQKMGRYKFYLIKVPRLIESFTLSFGLRIWVGTVPEFCWWKDCLVQGPLVQHGDGWDSVLYRGQHHHKGQGNCRTNRVTYIFCTYTVVTVSHCMCKSVNLVVRSAVTKANTSFGTAGWSERALF